MTSEQPNIPAPGIRKLVFIGEIAIIFTLLTVWLGSPSIRESKSLLVLFFYAIPSEFLIGLIPHEPILLYYGRFYSPLTVALVSVVGTVIAEWLNYSVFEFVNETTLFETMRTTQTVHKLIEWFLKAPFLAILFAGFTPVPFFPIRFLVVMGHYPVLKYLLGVFISRAPRFYILAQVGYFFRIPGAIIITLFVVLIFVMHYSLLRRLFKK